MTNRQPKGIPVGGRFAEGRKPDGGDLSAPFVNYIEKNVSGSDFSQERLVSGHFLGAMCVNTNFTGADLRKSDFFDADCTDAVFEIADLSESILMGKFTGASFALANLRDAACFQADFAGADFAGADVTGIDMSKATGLETATGLDTVEGEPKELPEGWSWTKERGIFSTEPPSTERKRLRVTNSMGVPWEVRIIRKGDRYGLNNCIVNDESSKFFHAGDPILVEFWDAGQDPAHFHEGCQFVSRYFLTTLLAPENMCAYRGLDLHGGEPRWSIDATTFIEIAEWLTPIMDEIKEQE